MRGLLPLAAALLILPLASLATEPPPGFAPGQIVPGPSIHQREAEAHALLPLPAGPTYPLVYTVAPEAGGEAEPRAEALTRTVYGFMPDWVVSDLTHVQWDKISHVAYFSVTMNPDGSITNLTGSYAWPSGSYVQALRSTAHANGVKVTLAATLFNSSDISTLLSSSTYRQNAVNNLRAQVLAGSADGVNIDFEGVPVAQKANLVTFMTALTSAFHSSIPGSHVSIDTPAVDWSGAFDYDQLAINCDGLFIMGYDYYWSGSSTAGPCAPLNSSTTWGTYCEAWTVSDYMTYGGSSNRDKFILGVPYYGYEYPTSSTSVPSGTTGSGTSKVYDTAKANAATHGRNWNASGQVPYYVYSSPSPHECFYDDDESLGLKWDLVNSQDLGGTGMWAMNYDTRDDLLWAKLQEKFGVPSGDLTGKKICLDPGHGGSDPGAVGPTGLQEKAVNLGTSLLLRDALQAKGATVYMTRTTDVDVSLSARTTYANSIPADRFESVHHNSSGTPSANYTGVHVYDDGTGTCPASTNSKDMAAKTALRLDAALNIGVVSTNCGIYGVHGDDFYVLHHTSMPAMLAEGSFISNPAEEALLYTDARRCTIAGAIAKGIEDHYAVSASDPPCASGTCGTPIAITTFPYTDSNTTTGKSANLNGYSCPPISGSEAGPEVIYQFTLKLAGSFTASVSDGSSVDVDPHLLSSCSPSACIIRDDNGFTTFLQPGTYTLVCDTWTSSGGTQYPGAYTLSASFATDTTAPAVPESLKWSKANARWQWDAASLDRLGNAETMGYYQMWKATNPTQAYSLVQDHIVATYLTDSSTPSAGVCWYYQLHAVDAAGNRDNPHLDSTQAYTQASYSGTWTQGSNADCMGGSGQYKYASTATTPTATATWTISPEESGTYAVYARFVAGTSNRTTIRYTVSDMDGSTTTNVDQTTNNCVWISLGSHALRSGQYYTVVLDNQATTGKVVLADAARWTKAP